MLTLVIQEMSKQFPTLMDTLVHERDQLVVFCLCLFLYFDTFLVVKRWQSLPGFYKKEEAESIGEQFSVSIWVY